MSKYDKTRAMLDLVEASTRDFCWTNCDQCIFGIAKAEGFFEGVPSNYVDGYINSNDMRHALGLTKEQKNEIFIGFYLNEEFHQRYARGEYITKAEALAYSRECVARWEAADILKTING